MLQPGTLFDSRYELVRKIGKGGFAEVWLAKDTLADLHEALKIYAPGEGLDEDGWKIFKKELAVVHDIHHSHILTPKLLAQYESQPYLVLQYCPNGSLKKYVGQCTEEQAWRILEQVASGLAYLHKNKIVHQDIKPDNILLDANLDCMIADFGISLRAQSTLRKSMRIQNVSGTMAYMAPERFSDDPYPIPANDIWSLGAMMFELIEGIVPFGEYGGGKQRKAGADIPKMRTEVSDSLKQLVYSLLALNIDDRPTAEQLIEIAKSKAYKKDVPQHSVVTGPVLQNLPVVNLPTKPVIPYPEKVTEPIIKPTQEKEKPKAIQRRKSSSWKKIVLGGVILSVLFLLCGILSEGLTLSVDQTTITCDENGLSDYYGYVSVYEPLFGNRLSNWWWDIEDIPWGCDVTKTMDGYSLRVSPNDSEDEREWTFTIKAKFGPQQTVRILQEKKNAVLTVSKSNIWLPFSGGKSTITVNANIAWEVETSDESAYQVTKDGDKLTINVSENSSSSARDGSVTVKSHSGKKTAEIQIHQPGKPMASIEKVWVDHNVYENGSKGMRIHVKFNIYNLKSKQCNAAAYFYTESGNALKDKNQSYRTTSGEVSCGEDFKPGYENTLYSDFKLFMPYSELHVNYKGSFKFFVNLWDYSVTPHRDLAESDWVSFTYTP